MGKKRPNAARLMIQRINGSGLWSRSAIFGHPTSHTTPPIEDLSQFHNSPYYSSERCLTRLKSSRRPTCDYHAHCTLDLARASKVRHVYTMDSSTTLPSSFIMSKFFGVTHEQALRVQALLRLGISEDDVRVAERLMAPRSATDRVSGHLSPTVL